MYWGNIGNAAKTKPEAHYEKTLIHGHQESVMELVSSQTAERIDPLEEQVSDDSSARDELEEIEKITNDHKESEEQVKTRGTVKG